MRDDERIRTLIERLSDPWKPTRNEAAQALVDVGEAVIPQMAELLNGPDDDLAAYAVWVLEMLDTPEALALLETYWS